MRLDAVAFHRLAHRSWRAKIPLLPRVIDALIFVLFNSRIHHSTAIGRGTFCAYRGMSVLVHKQAVIGERVTLGPHLVIGGRSGQPPPVIGDDVYIGANVCIVGGLKVGNGATIGAGAVVLSDVAAGDVVAGNPAHTLHRPRAD